MSNMPENLTLLETISEETVLEALRARHAQDDIYTAIGSVIISVNPYKSLPQMFCHKVMSDYHNRNIFESKPHIFALADNAFQLMSRDMKDQCVIISGESGAGKTEASKIFLNYIANSVGAEIQPKVVQITDQLLYANPILESFGNSKTILNDNSSRFGKYMDVMFDFHSVPTGGKITTYLLEKSRVTQIPASERSFHIFYQLLRGGDAKRLESLHLTSNIQDYFYLSQSKCNAVDGTDDSKEFEKTIQALSQSLRNDQVHYILQVIAAVLHLGNIEFSTGEDLISIKSELPLNHAASLLGVPAESLKRVLMFRTLKDQSKQNNNNDGSITVPLTKEKAVETRDALAKALYGRLFEKLVILINDQLQSKRKSLMTATCNVIGVLDIFGFEALESNSFEQFVINYCNEKLQQIFIELVLKQEQDEYAKEGIAWTEIAYFNNKIICDLIEGKFGIISTLDEECVMPGNPTDQSFLEKLDSGSLGRHAHYDSKGKSHKSKLRLGTFRLKHYAGDVDYDVQGFLQKNKDTLYSDLVGAMSISSKPFIKHLFPECSDIANLKRPETLATQFKNSMSQLMKNLLAKNPHYIRCIKSNNYKKPGVFDDELVLHQIRFLGLTENIRVKVAGFCFRGPIATFVARFKMLSSTTWPNPRSNDDVVNIKRICSDFGITESEYQLGKTKIFIKKPSTVNRLEHSRNEYKHRLATKLRSKWLAFRTRKDFLRTRFLIVKVQSSIRRHQSRQRFMKLVWASIIMSKNTKTLLQKRAYRKILFKMPKRAAPYIQRAYRKYKTALYIENIKRSITTPGANWRAINWPTPSKSRYSADSALLEFVKIFYARVMAKKYRSALTQEAKGMLIWKSSALDRFAGKESFAASFHSSYIKVRTEFDEACLQTITLLINDHKGINAKLHRHSLNKEVPAAIVLTPSHLFLLTLAKTWEVKSKIDLKDISGVSTSKFSDGLFIIHIPKNPKGDLILRSEEYCIEFLAVLCVCLANIQQKTPIVKVTAKIDFMMQQKVESIQFSSVNDKTMSLKHTNNSWLAAVPRVQGNASTRKL